MTDDLTRTGSRTDSGDAAQLAALDQPRLIVALEGARPWVPGLRLALATLRGDFRRSPR